tara:strand:+ start:4967 stop:6112 length:1146 start_codon:yes stop_codon:yes gene_type:complete
MSLIKFKNFSIANYFSKTKRNQLIDNLIIKKSKYSSLLFLEKNFNPLNLSENNKIIEYSEPEDHINKVARLLIKNSNFKNLKVLGISSKDTTLINEIKKIKNKTFTKIFSKNTSLENAIDKFYKINSEQKFNIIIMRHIWEHIPEQKLFLKKIKKILDEKHIIYIEVPDCKKLIRNFDYSMIWEEHMYYYNQTNLKYELTKLGLKKIKFLRVSHPQEDNLCFLLKVSDIKKYKNLLDKKSDYYSKMFIKKFNINKKNTKNFFLRLKKSGFNFYFFGASHMLNTFLNIYDLKNYTDFVIDDNKKKINKFFAGLENKIISLKDVKKNEIKKTIFFISCNISAEKKIIKRLKLLDKSVLFFSIFPLSKNYFFKKKLIYENKKNK